MKSVTEFASFTLTKGLSTKAALTTEGKTPEEVQQGLGEAFKLEGDKLKHFIAALDVASQNSENLKRVFVVSLAEGERAPNKATKVEELYFVPDFHVTAKPAASAEDKNKRGGKGGRRGGGGGNDKKSSPWGLSPEEKAAKKAKGPVAVADKK